MSFILQQIEKEGGLARIVTMKQGGRDCWFVVKLNPETYQHYKKALKTATLTIGHYGDILDSGWGEVPQSVVAEYGNV